MAAMGYAEYGYHLIENNNRQLNKWFGRKNYKHLVCKFHVINTNQNVKVFSICLAFSVMPTMGYTEKLHFAVEMAADSPRW